MIEISHEDGVGRVLDALYARRLALLCGAGLLMAPPSSLPSAASLAVKAKRKYDATFGADRLPLPATIDEQSNFFSIGMNFTQFIFVPILTETRLLLHQTWDTLRQLT